MTTMPGMGEKSLCRGDADCCVLSGRLIPVCAQTGSVQALKADLPVFSDQENLTEQAKKTWLDDNISFLNQSADVFAKNATCYFLTIDFDIASLLARNTQWQQSLQNLPFVSLVLNECFPNLVDGLKNPLLYALRARFPLILGDLGKGDVPFHVVSSGLFSGVILDGAFFQRYYRSPVLQIVLNKAREYSEFVAVGGVDSPAHYHEAKKLRGVSLMGKSLPASPVLGAESVFNNSFLIN